MNNPEALRFVNEVVRPMCEEVRALGIKLDSLSIAWFAGLDANFATAGDPIEDNREGEGISRLTCGDVTNAISQLIKTAPGQAAAWDKGVIQRPCVRQLP